MALISTTVCLRGYGGKEPTGTLFFDLLGLTPDDEYRMHPSDSAWKAALIDFVEVTIEDCIKASEPHTEFVARINSGLHRAATWLSRDREKGIEEWRQGGRKVDVFIGGWMEDNQFDFNFPPDFLLACGRLGLPITICTND